MTCRHQSFDRGCTVLHIAETAGCVTSRLRGGRPNVEQERQSDNSKFTKFMGQMLFEITIWPKRRQELHNTRIDLKTTLFNRSSTTKFPMITAF